MATIAPPIKPRPRLPTAQTRRKYYTIHSNNNNAFSLKLNDDVKTAIVGFKDVDDALRIGSMIETHYIQYKEWPETRDPGSLILPTNRLNTLSHIFFRVWTFNDLKLECTNNFWISLQSSPLHQINPTHIHSTETFTLLKLLMNSIIIESVNFTT